MDLKREAARDDSVTYGYCHGRARIAKPSTPMGRGCGRSTVTYGYCYKIGHNMDKHFLFEQNLGGVSGIRQRVKSETKCFKQLQIQSI